MRFQNFVRSRRIRRSSCSQVKKIFPLFETPSARARTTTSRRTSIPTSYGLPSNEPSVVVLQQVGALLAGGYLVWANQERLHFTFRGAAIAMFTGVLGVIGLYFYVRAAARQNVAIVATTTALYPVVTLALGATFLRERISWTQSCGVGLAFLAILLIAGGSGNSESAGIAAPSGPQPPTPAAQTSEQSSATLAAEENRE